MRFFWVQLPRLPPRKDLKSVTTNVELWRKVMRRDALPFQWIAMRLITGGFQWDGTFLGAERPWWCETRWSVAAKR